MFAIAVFAFVPFYNSDGCRDYGGAPQYDGERMIVHMANGALTCYTRNCNDSTKLYGPFLKKLEDCIKVRSILACTKFEVQRFPLAQSYPVCQRQSWN